MGPVQQIGGLQPPKHTLKINKILLSLMSGQLHVNYCKMVRNCVPPGKLNVMSLWTSIIFTLFTWSCLTHISHVFPTCRLCETRSGEICNACVLLVKRCKKLPVGSKKNWNHVSSTFFFVYICSSLLTCLLEMVKKEKKLWECLSSLLSSLSYILS